ncbi:branched-chain amino acid ABC transporter ATP-binding protein [Lacticaseibacillus sp. 866-1]|uniref:branched-chain amino acid ABC transporter ATP-binding protein n=1 Tax=Lacticaseibacillus sp. 866-1 TaxID=2799576 RepID=UPI0019409B9B|nr:branched-chain amino acid ABC transporter ATP-binding protein [Lacticaseibacillus sp. 866-1]
MTLFHPQMAQSFRDHVQTLFAPGTTSFVFVSADSLSQTFAAYTQAFVSGGCTKALALVDETDTGIVPYLSVRANLLINSRGPALNQLPEALRQDTLFLDQPASQLTPAESLYVQFFRGLMGKRSVILAKGLPAVMVPTETRAFLSFANQALAGTHSRFVILTADQSLIDAHPDHSFTRAPSLAAASDGTKKHA